VHCEQPELIRVLSRRVVQESVLAGLAAYSAARPPLTERLAIAEVSVLADATSCSVNLLHLSSRDALAAAIELRRALPRLDVRAETTVNYLGLTHETYGDQRAKVNPPIRAGEDRDALWSGVLTGDIDWIASDHCCCSEVDKEGDLWRAFPGFGGTALLYPFLLTEGVRRGLSIERIVELVSTNPARAFGLAPRKGAITLGADADLVIVDMEEVHEVTPERLLSAQDFTPFAGMPLVGWPVRTLLRGVTGFAEGRLVGEPRGEFIRRPIPPVGTLDAPVPP
jgi:dihydroorotase-like cyclic amidohydrolase